MQEGAGNGEGLSSTSLDLTCCSSSPRSASYAQARLTLKGGGSGLSAGSCGSCNEVGCTAAVLYDSSESTSDQTTEPTPSELLADLSPRPSTQQLSFKDKVVVVTGAGGGLGKAYSTFFASRGAKVLVNDFSKEAADKAVKEINDAGGEAIANYSDVTQGAEIIKQVMDKWGRVDILLNK